MNDDIVTRLRALISDLRKTVPQTLMIEAADEIERLRAESQMWRNTCTKLIGMILPFSLLMRENEREELKIILGEAIHNG